MNEVPNFGVHFVNGDIPFLLQQDNAQSIFEDLPCPLKVIPSPVRKRCNHSIRLNQPDPEPQHLEAFERLKDDPLLRAMLPTPALHRGFTIENPSQVVLATLSRMSSPVATTIRPAWALEPKMILEELGITNCQPLVLINSGHSDHHITCRVASAVFGLPRTVIVATRGTPLPAAGMERISTDLDHTDLTDLVTLPWEQIGAWVLRRHMKGETI